MLADEHGMLVAGLLVQHGMLGCWFASLAWDAGGPAWDAGMLVCWRTSICCLLDVSIIPARPQQNPFLTYHIS